MSVTNVCSDSRTLQQRGQPMMGSALFGAVRHKDFLMKNASRQTLQSVRLIYQDS